MQESKITFIKKLRVDKFTEFYPLGSGGQGVKIAAQLLVPRLSILVIIQ
jgi:hypothetical protein